MTGEDWLLFLGILIVVAVGAYALGARGRQSAMAAPVPSPAPATTSKPHAVVDDDEVVVSVGETESIDDVDLLTPASVEPPVAAVTEAAEVKTNERSIPVLPKIYDAEDEDVDVTRVGSLNAPALRPIVQAPVILLDDVGEEEPEEREAASATPYFLISATAQTDTGLRRKRNEDSLLANQSANLFVVADGMGGHRGGEHASRLAVKTIDDAFVAGNFEGTPHEGVPADASELARAMQMANASILEMATVKPELGGMGTTLCCARFSPTKRRVHIGHVGDSRCYRLRDGIFTQLTSDHTMADLGLTGPEAGNLSRAVGIWSTVPIDMIVDAPAPSDVYLLCSDGLTKMLDDERIAHILRSEDDAQAAVNRLIFFANSRGGKDNITVILIRVVTPANAASMQQL